MTDNGIDTWEGALHAGMGWVARWPGVVVVIPPHDEHEAAAEQLLDDLNQDPDPERVRQAIATHAVRGTLKGVAYVAYDERHPARLIGFACGPTEVLRDGQVAAGEANRLQEVGLGVSGQVTIRFTADSYSAAPTPPFDLRVGIVPGGGITLTPVAARPERPVRPVAVTPPAPPPVARAVTAPPVAPVVVASAAVAPPVAPVEAAAHGGVTPTPEAAAESPAPGSGPEAAASALTPSLGGTTAERRAAQIDVATVEQSVADDAGASPAAVEAAVADSGAPTGALTPVPAQAVPFQSVVLGPNPGVAPLGPLPMARPPEPPPADQTGPGGVPVPSHRHTSPDIPVGDQDVTVEGILCSRHHFNNPAASYCIVCGISMVHVTHNLVPGPRPTLGFVVFDNGSTYGLDRSYVIGRDPGTTTERNTAPLAIHDDNETLSRRHAELRLVDWEVQIVDLGSTNGSFVWDVNFERWNQIAPNQPVILSPGDTVALGRRTFVFESVTKL